MKYVQLLIMSLFMACQNHSDRNNLEFISIVKINSDDCREVNLSEYFTKPKILPLETNELVLIGNPSKIQFHDNKIFILDNARQIIWIFNKLDGKYLNKIERIGAGPGEYSFLKDFWITPEGNLVIYDKAQSRLIYFNEHADYISQQRINFYFQSGMALENNLFALYSASDNTHLSKALRHNILIYNKIKNEIVDFGSYNHFEPNGFILHKNLTYADSYKKILCSVSFNDTLYEVTSEGVNPLFYIDFNKKIKEEHQKSKLTYEDIFNVYKTDGANYNIKNLSKIANGIYFEFGSMKEGLVRNMKAIVLNNQEEGFCIKKLYDDYNGMNVVNFIGNHEDEIVYLINPREIKRVFGSTIKGEIKQLIDTHGENANPFLYFLNVNEEKSF